MTDTATYTVRPRGRSWLASVHFKNDRWRRSWATRRLAEEWAKTLCDSFNGTAGVSYPQWDGSVKGLVELAYERHYKRETKYPAKHRSTLNRIVSVMGPGFPVNELNTGPGIEKLRARLSEDGLTPSSVNRVLAVARTSLRLAARLGLIPAVTEFSWCKEARHHRKAVPTEDVQRIVDYLHANGHITFAYLVTVLAHTGLRLNEALAVTRDDLVLSKDGVTYLKVETGKHPNSPPARIPLSDQARGCLAAAYGSNGTIPMSLDPNSVPLFSELPKYDTLRKLWMKALDHLELKGYTLHSLRHTFCTRLVAAGVPLATVRYLARHKSITTTMRYAHAAPNADSLVLETLNNDF